MGAQVPFLARRGEKTQVEAQKNFKEMEKSVCEVRHLS